MIIVNSNSYGWRCSLSHRDVYTLSSFCSSLCLSEPLVLLMSTPSALTTTIPDTPVVARTPVVPRTIQSPTLGPMRRGLRRSKPTVAAKKRSVRPRAPLPPPEGPWGSKYARVDLEQRLPDLVPRPVPDVPAASLPVLSASPVCVGGVPPVPLQPDSPLPRLPPIPAFRPEHYTTTTIRVETRTMSVTQRLPLGLAMPRGLGGVLVELESRGLVERRRWRGWLQEMQPLLLPPPMSASSAPAPELGALLCSEDLEEPTEEPDDLPTVRYAPDSQTPESEDTSSSLSDALGLLGTIIRATSSSSSRRT